MEQKINEKLGRGAAVEADNLQPRSSTSSTASLKSLMNSTSGHQRVNPSGTDLNNEPLIEYEVPLNFQTSCLELLKCHNCPQIMYPPIYLCRKGGHAFCRVCMKGKKCRLCKSYFSKTRNHYLESMASLLRLKCSHVLCEEMISGEQIDIHKTSCQYRPVKCFETGIKKCKGQPINFDNYEEHLHQIHQCKVEELRPAGDFTCLLFPFNNLLVDANRFSSRILTFGKKTFIFQLRKFSGTEICFALFFLGGVTEAQQYRCDLLLQNTQGAFSKIQWTIEVFSIHKPLDEMHNTGNLFVIPVKTLVPFYSLDSTTTTIGQGNGKSAKKTQLSISVGVRIDSA